MSCGFYDYGSCGVMYRVRTYGCGGGNGGYGSCGGSYYGGRYPANYFGSCGGGGCGRTYEYYSTGCGSGSC